MPEAILARVALKKAAVLGEVPVRKVAMIVSIFFRISRASLGSGPTSVFSWDVFEGCGVLGAFLSSFPAPLQFLELKGSLGGIRQAWVKPDFLGPSLHFSLLC